jgi:hypothetical protein
MKRRSKKPWTNTDIFLLVAVFYLLGIFTSFLFYLFILFQHETPSLVREEKTIDYSRLYIFTVKDDGGIRKKDGKRSPRNASLSYSKSADVREYERWAAATVIRSALYQFVEKNGYMPKSLSILTQSFPHNYLTALPKEPLTLSNKVFHHFTGTGGWVYQPQTMDNQAEEKWAELVERSLFPNVEEGKNQVVDFEPLEIKIIKSRNELQLVSGKFTVRAYQVGLGTENSTPDGTFIIQKKVMNPNKRHVPFAKSPYGKRGLQLSHYAIHGTNEPESIGKNRSKGCIRMHNEDIIELYSMIPLYTSVEIVSGPNNESLDRLGRKTVKENPPTTVSNRNHIGQTRQLYDQSDHKKEEDPEHIYLWAG